MGYALVKQLLILVYFVYVGLNGGKGVDYAAHFILTVDLIYLFLPVFVPYPPHILRQLFKRLRYARGY